MLLRYIRIGVLAVVLLGAACSPEPVTKSIQQQAEDLWYSPAPTPTFLIRNYPLPGAHDEGQCIDIDTGAVFEPGDTPTGIVENLERTLYTTVDNQPPGKAWAGGDLFVEYGVTDSSGNLIGSHGGPSALCFTSANLEPGFHMATIYFESTAGRPFTYTWAFKIKP